MHFDTESALKRKELVKIYNEFCSYILYYIIVQGIPQQMEAND